MAKRCKIGLWCICGDGISIATIFDPRPDLGSKMVAVEMRPPYPFPLSGRIGGEMYQEVVGRLSIFTNPYPLTLPITPQNCGSQNCPFKLWPNGIRWTNTWIDRRCEVIVVANPPNYQQHHGIQTITRDVPRELKYRKPQKDPGSKDLWLLMAWTRWSRVESKTVSVYGAS